jgi:CVNH domain
MKLFSKFRTIAAATGALVVGSRLRRTAVATAFAACMAVGFTGAMTAPAHAQSAHTTQSAQAESPAAASAQIVPYINFGDSCGNVYVDSRGVLHATCKRRDGSLNNTSLGLDQYVGNNNGFLAPNSSHFTETCIDIGGGVTLEARCRARNGTFDNTTLNLNNWVDNTNGFLVWVS